jgi:hypothetical protein
MKLIETMILWNSKGRHKFAELPIVKAVVHCGDEAQKYDYLRKSLGACMGGWKSSTPLARATHILSLFHQMIIRDNISPADVHNAFMEIDEYREFHKNPEGDEDAEEDNPFKQAYWAFAANRGNEPIL